MDGPNRNVNFALFEALGPAEVQTEEPTNQTRYPLLCAYH